MLERTLLIHGEGRDAFRAEVDRLSESETGACYQCGKCTAGCPVCDEMDLTPNQILHLLRLGDKDALFGSRTIWICASCEACTTRCPKDINIAGVMDALREMALREGVRAADPGIVRFNKIFMSQVRSLGRLFEPAMVGLFNMSQGKPFKDMLLGARMFLKGRLNPLPHLTRGRRQAKKMAERIKEIEGRDE